jgi:hypothetical protein
MTNNSSSIRETFFSFRLSETLGVSGVPRWRYSHHEIGQNMSNYMERYEEQRHYILYI